jgi:hypothetical protein
MLLCIGLFFHAKTESTQIGIPILWSPCDVSLNIIRVNMSLHNIERVVIILQHFQNFFISLRLSLHGVSFQGESVDVESHPVLTLSIWRKTSHQLSPSGMIKISKRYISKVENKTEFTQKPHYFIWPENAWLSETPKQTEKNVFWFRETNRKTTETD